MIVSITIRGLPNYCLFVLFLLFSRYILLEHDFDTDAWLRKKICSNSCIYSDARIVSSTPVRRHALWTENFILKIWHCFVCKLRGKPLNPLADHHLPYCNWYISGVQSHLQTPSRRHRSPGGVRAKIHWISTSWRCQRICNLKTCNSAKWKKWNGCKLSVRCMW